MAEFATRQLPVAPDVLAPDGSRVRLLLSLAGGSMAHFELPAGEVARAVRHRTVEEIWFVVAGNGELWRSCDGRSETVSLSVGTSVTIPLGTAFQFRASAGGPLGILGVTMPPWPGEGEAIPADGRWRPTV